MKNIKIRVALCDEFKEEELSEGQFEIPETDRINISEIERLFLNAETPSLSFALFLLPSALYVWNVIQNI